MPSSFDLPADLDISATEGFTKARLDRAFAYIVQRLMILDQFKPAWEDQVSQLRQIGLTRIDDALRPVYDAVTSIASLGAIFTALSADSVTVATGLATFTVPSAERSQFAPARWMSAINDDATASMAGLVQSYDREAGTLVVQVVETYGSGTYASWQISPTSPPILSAAVVDGGVYDGRTAEHTVTPYLYAGPLATSTSTDGGTF